MGTLSPSRIVAGIVAAMAIVVGGAGMGATAAQTADGGAPFVALFTGEAVFTSETTVSFDGAGIATHLGRAANDGHASITGPDASCPGGLANTHVETLTAADGDSLTITATDVACPIGELRFRGTGTWVVTGGTGRFDDATGTGNLIGGVDFVTQRFVFALAGTLTLPAA